jgi:glycosyltransferase involved in cell wall biosynthesis
MCASHDVSMRILLVHNFYRSSAPSGEDEVVRSEQALLEANGIEVVPFMRYNDDLPAGVMGAIGASLSNAWSLSSRTELRKLIAERRPDVAHFHNTFPQISPAAYEICREAGVPVVQTLHNYRMFCANGLLNMRGEPCERCVGRGPMPALVHACYRDSRFATAGMALGTSVHRARKTYLTQVDRYIVHTEFARSRFIAHGLPAERIAIRGNCLAYDPGRGDGAGNYALYVGRLTGEKGVGTLIRAWRKLPNIPLLVAGDGELRDALQREAQGLPVEFLGRVPATRVIELMRDASMLVVPSECYEGFPRVVVEAFATGTAIVAADIGGLGELIVEGVNGSKFRSGSSDELAEVASRVWLATQARTRERNESRERFLREFSPEAGYRTLRSIYDDVRRSPRRLSAAIAT